MKTIQFTLFAITLALAVYLVAQNETIKNELKSHEKEALQFKQLFVSGTTIFEAKERHSYFIKAKLDRENGETVVVPIFQTSIGDSGDDKGEASLHLVEHTSENNQRYFKLRRERGSAWSVSNHWKQLVAPEGYDLSSNEWNYILNMLFSRDVWNGSVESIGRWKLSGQEFYTRGGIIIEEIEGSLSDATMGVGL